MDFISNDAGSSPTYYVLFSSVLFLLLFTTLSYKRPISCILSEDDNLSLGYPF